MEKYLVSARKYRPATFDTVVGQKALTMTLRNAIATGRLAHAYLFCGSRGVGKTSCARIFAKTINCQHPTPDGNPCNECDSCRAFNEGRSLNIVELDAASNNGVEDIRQLCDQVLVPPTNGKYRVFIIDEVHMLSVAAFNSFLKTLEEPPSYVIFILATTEKHKILPTILSRCQIYDFNRITITDMVNHLEYVAKSEGMTAERSALNVIASKADGAMRDALSIFDQVAASSRGNITYQSTIENLNVLDANYYSRLVDAFIAEDVTTALLIYKEIRDKGFDSHFFVVGLAQYMRDLLVSRTEQTLALLDTDDSVKNIMREQAKKAEPRFFYEAMALCNDADLNYRAATNKIFLVEILLIKLCQLQSPSPTYSGQGEGQIKPIPAMHQNDNPGAQTNGLNPASQQPKPAAAVGSTPNPAQKTPSTGTTTILPPPPPPKPIERTYVTTPIFRSIKEPVKKTEPTVQQTQVQSRRGQYTDEQVITAWRQFMAAHPTEKVLINTMRASEPQKIANDTYKIIVENQVQHNLVISFLRDIYDHIHNQIGNDYWTLEIEENRGVSSPATWNDREVLNYMTEHTPEVRDLISHLKLHL
ncbi:MAG: DNA polymerase III subunit gamma/tau [Muribaculaceae bacterium]